MAWQSEVGAAQAQATDYHDLLNKQVQFYCSRHVATATVDSGGSGYSVGDIVELPHASAHLVARFEVTSESSGVVTGLRIVCNGAYAQQAASATVSAGGSGYVVGDVLEVQGGSSRCPAKFSVATLSGSAVATVSLFEGGGVYSSTPSNPAATEGVGPAAFAGNDACTLTITYQSIIGTSGLSTTSASGTGLTVDITLAETGWAVDGRNTNNSSFNSVSNEKQVVLIGDGTGLTNKPYIGLATLTQTSGVDTRYAIAHIGLITHNPSLALDLQLGIRGNPGTFSDGNAYILCDENQLQSMDFWLSADDLRVCGVVNINPSAVLTDNGLYQHFYHGYGNTYATETEDPYPMVVFAAARATNINPSIATSNITGLSEHLTGTGLSGPGAFYQSEAGAWRAITNSQNTANQQNTTICMPMARMTPISGATDPNRIVNEGPMRFDTGFGSLNRSSPTVRLLPVPGSSDLLYPIPLTILYRPGGSTLNETLDTPRVQLRDCFFVYNTNGSGATISNFSEDYITIGSDRYRVFHTHTSTQLYSYICIREDV